MSNPTLCPVLKQRFFDNNGLPLTGGKLFSYTAGTSTPQATYTDESGLTPNANPIILDSAGYASVWIGSGSYKFILEDSLGNILFTVDDVTAISNSPNTGGPQTFTIADNQSSYQNVTGMSVDHTVNGCEVIEYTMIRSDGTNKRREHGYLYLTYDSQNGWVLSRTSQPTTDVLNIANSLAVTAGGQVQYKSDSMGGTYAGKITWQVQSAFATEGI